MGFKIKGLEVQGLLPAGESRVGLWFWWRVSTGCSGTCLSLTPAAFGNSMDTLNAGHALCSQTACL